MGQSPLCRGKVSSLPGMISTPCIRYDQHLHESGHLLGLLCCKEIIFNAL